MDDDTTFPNPDSRATAAWPNWEAWLEVTLAYNPIPSYADEGYALWLQDKIAVFARGDDALAREMWQVVQDHARRKQHYSQYLASRAWQEKRAAKLAEADHCERCGGAHGLQVHHRVYGRRGFERLGDLMVLCKDCHGTLHYELAWGPE